MPIHGFPPSAASGALPFDWPNAAMSSVRQPNRARPKLKRPKLTDARKMAREYPDTFELPLKASIARLKVGDFAKVDIPGERFWVMVSKRTGSKFEGVIDNDLIATKLHGLRLGDRIAFESKHLYDAMTKEQMHRALATQLAANPLDPHSSSRRRSDAIPALDSRVRRLKGHVESIDDILDRGKPSSDERRVLVEDKQRFEREIASLLNKIDAIESTIELEGDLIEAPPPSLWRTRTQNPFVGQPDPGVRTDLEIFSADQLHAMPTLATGQVDDLKYKTRKNRWWLDRGAPESGATHRVTVEELDLDDGRWWPVHYYAPY